MGDDVRALLEVLQGDLSSNASSVYAAMIAGAFFLYFGQIFMFIVILRKKIQPDELNLEDGSGSGKIEMAKQS
jgi:hypothetical protein